VKAKKEKPDRDGMEREPDLELGHDHTLYFTSWEPDDLPGNRKTYGIPAGQPMPKVERAGALVGHPNLKEPGKRCFSGITFDLPELPELTKGARWQVKSMDPLTLAPSLLCRACGDHGSIRDGKWVPA
jgi:hypothetical protein